MVLPSAAPGTGYASELLSFWFWCFAALILTVKCVHVQEQRAAAPGLMRRPSRPLQRVTVALFHGSSPNTCEDAHLTATLPPVPA